MAQIKLKPRGLAKHRKAAGITTDPELASRLGVDRTTVHRILAGDADPGTRFIAGAVLAFGVESFDELFRVVA